MIKYKKQIMLLTIITLVLFLIPTLSNATNAIINDNTNKALGELKNTISEITNIVIVFAVTSSTLIFIIHFISLGKNSDNPNKRSIASNNILTTGIITALLGSIGLITKLFLSFY